MWEKRRKIRRLHNEKEKINRQVMKSKNKDDKRGKKEEVKKEDRIQEIMNKIK